MEGGKSRILIIYTGGTIGMVRDEKKGTLRPFRLKRIIRSVPSILELGLEIHALELKEVIDSSNMRPALWIELARQIEAHYEQFDGFVILHGSDTMAYSASALSFLLENLAKPVIFTGSQLPLGLPRTDARENLITALEIAGFRNDMGKPLIPEVCIYFEDRLYRGNRTFKYNSENFDAFLSPNYRPLAEVGVSIKVYPKLLRPVPEGPLTVHQELSNRIAVLHLFPGIDIAAHVEMFLNNDIELVILQTYGAGNSPTDVRFLKNIEKLIRNNIIVLNVTQCRQGRVDMTKYESGAALAALGVANGKDMTLEAAITKSMFVVAHHTEMNIRRQLLETDLRGELTT